MEERLDPIQLPDEILDGLSGGDLNGTDKASIRRYVKWFKDRDYSEKATQRYWIDAMRVKGISSYTEDEAKQFISSIWESV